MAGLSFKYLLKRGIKKTSENIFRNIVSVLLCAVCAMLTAYSELFFTYDPAAVEAHAVKNLGEEDYKYIRNFKTLHSDGRECEPLSDEAFGYIKSACGALKYVNLIMSDDHIFNGSYYSYDAMYDFYLINSADDVLSFGYTFYGDYPGDLSGENVYITDTYLKDGKYYLYEDGEWKRQYYGDYLSFSPDEYSSFVGKEIYLESYEGAKVKIAGVVNTGAYELNFRDIGLTGVNEYGEDLNTLHTQYLYHSESQAIGCGVFCTEEFVRSFAVKEGSVLIGGMPVFARRSYVNGRQDVSFSVEGENAAYESEGEYITVSNTGRFSNDNNRRYFVSYMDDECYHVLPCQASKDYTPVSYESKDETSGVMERINEIVSDGDICGEGEIIITTSLYQKIYDETYNPTKTLPEHIGEKLSVKITVDGEVYELKDKILIGVTSLPTSYYDEDTSYGIICKDGETDRLLYDYSAANYSSVINISGLSENKLASLIRTLKEDYGVELDIIGYDAAFYEGESIGIAKNIYLAISAVLFVMSLLFGVWNVMHAVKRDYREIGILRANGVAAKDMSVIYAVQFIICGAISFALSVIGLNILTACYTSSERIVRSCLSYLPEISLYWVGPAEVLLLLAVSLIVPLLVSLSAFFRVRKISPVEAINEAKKNG